MIYRSYIDNIFQFFLIWEFQPLNLVTAELEMIAIDLIGDPVPSYFSW